MKHAQGISLIDVLLTIAFSTILLSVAIPGIGLMRDNYRRDEIVELINDIGRSSHRFLKDTGQPAIEFAAAKDGQSYVHPRYHQLSMPQEIQGWRGPYLKSPLSCSDNPYGASIYIIDKLNVSPAHGFDLKANGEIVGGPGQFVVLYGVPERIAKMVDTVIDDEFCESASWDSVGRVEWAPGGGGSLSVHLLTLGQQESKR